MYAFAVGVFDFIALNFAILSVYPTVDEINLDWQPVTVQSFF